MRFCLISYCFVYIFWCARSLLKIVHFVSVIAASFVSPGLISSVSIALLREVHGTRYETTHSVA